MGNGKGSFKYNLFCLFLPLLLAVASGCTGASSVPEFNFNSANSGTPSSAPHWHWSTLGRIDAANSIMRVNDDISAFCSNTSGADSYLLHSATVNGAFALDGSTRGCMQAAPVLYSDSRWLAGFAQNYLNLSGDTDTGGTTYILRGFSAFVNMTSLTTNLFGTFGAGLGVIDAGDGMTPIPLTTASRNMRFAKFPNGDVAAVFSVDRFNAAQIRSVYANVYDHVTNTWGTPARLSANAAATDLISDFTDPNTNLTNFGVYSAKICKPAVATAGDGSAMAVWCEDAGAGVSRMRYSRYAGGSWSAASNVITSATNYLPEFNAGTTTVINTDVQSGDEVSLGINIDGRFYAVKVVGVTTTPGNSQYRVISTNFCQTVRNMAGALLSSSPVCGHTAGSAYYTGACDGLTDSETQYATTLSSMGVSIVVDPNCTGTSTTVTAYYNKSLKPYIGADGATDHQIQDFYFNGVMSPTTAFSPSVLGMNLNWAGTGELSLSGDGSGNYVLVRTMPAPFFISDQLDDQDVRFGRMLLGHRWLQGSTRWFEALADSDTDYVPQTTIPNSVAKAKYISNFPACHDGTDYFACSVKNPKVMLSDSGSGLILFHQNQLTGIPSAAAVPSSFPNRLWYSTFSSNTGFSSQANILDEDSVCSSSSFNNDTSVCETESFSDVGTSGNECQTRNAYASEVIPIDYAALREQSLLDNLAAGGTERYLLRKLSSGEAPLNHEIQPIASAMNASGQAVVAFHKKVPVADSSGTVACGYVRTNVVLFDPVTGMGSAAQIDDALGNTLHVQVAINTSGHAAVVWEQVSDSDGDGDVDADYVYLSLWDGASWSTPALMNTGFTIPNDSMMPSVGINDDGEVLVTFTYGTTGFTRMQYATRYYVH